MIHERRRMPRYPFDADIQINDDTGSTINLSGNGVFFETTRWFAPGEEVVLRFPSENTGVGAVVTCEAKIVRVEPRGSYFGVAATYKPLPVTVPK